MAATFELESTLTDRYQTTVPDAVRRALKLGKRTDLSEWLVKTGAIFIEYTPEAFGEFVRGQIEKWRKISAETGIKAE